MTEVKQNEEIDAALVDDNAIGDNMVTPKGKRTVKSWEWNPRRKNTGNYVPNKPYRRGEKVKDDFSEYNSAYARFLKGTKPNDQEQDGE